MHIVSVLKLVVVSMALLFLCSGLTAVAVGQETADSQTGLPPGGQSAIVVHSEQLPYLLHPTDVEAWKPEAWKPDSDPERSRDAFAGSVYEQVAPATVVIRGGSGHGSGFFIDPKGWLVTNHHVIAGAFVDLRNGAQVAMVHLGRLEGGRMQLLDEPVPAVVYQTSETQDLALLKLIRLPEGWQTVPFLELAGEAPRPGQRCLTVAHPAAGMLWTLRSGLVSGMGRWPRDMMEPIIRRLGLADDADRDSIREALIVEDRMKILLSECGLNPGDSGGPLVNQQGELIAVNFAIPLLDSRRGVDLGKFSYHIHLQEVRDFLADRPATPRIHVPQAWPPGTVYRILDLDNDGIADSLLVAAREGVPFTAALLDLGQKGAAVNPELLNVKAIVERRSWDYTFALHLAPQRRAFYDTNGNGKFDLIMQDGNGDGMADLVLELADGRWGLRDPRDRPLLDPSLIQDESRSKRLRHILSVMRLTD